MRPLIVSIKQHLADYSEFVEALDSVGVEALVVHNLKYCFLRASALTYDSCSQTA